MVDQLKTDAIRTHYSGNGWSPSFLHKETMVTEDQWIIAADRLHVREGIYFRVRTLRYDAIVPALRVAFPERYFIASCHGGIVRIVRLDDTAEKILIAEGNSTLEMRSHQKNTVLKSLS